jgi:hypothetical protein
LLSIASPPLLKFRALAAQVLLEHGKVDVAPVAYIHSGYSPFRDEPPDRLPRQYPQFFQLRDREHLWLAACLRHFAPPVSMQLGVISLCPGWEDCQKPIRLLTLQSRWDIVALKARLLGLSQILHRGANATSTEAKTCGG